ncbi:MAG: 3-keto-5-aminohexanoate cleavage protein [Solirubrobacteraceae bacterium]
MTTAPLVIVAAVNGGMQMDRDGARVPVSPEEIAEDARLCAEAGAAIVHVHARDGNGRNTGDTAVFSEIIRQIRDRCDILIQTTNGVGVHRDPRTGQMIWPADEERLALVNLQPSPDLYGVAAGSTDFFHPEGGYHVETPYVNSPQFLKETIRADTEYLVYLRQQGLRLFPNAQWGVIGAGHANFTWATLGMAMGCTTARIGFEDGVYLPDGRVAERNRELVEELVRIAAIFGRRPATPAQARAIMGRDRGQTSPRRHSR